MHNLRLKQIEEEEAAKIKEQEEAAAREVEKQLQMKQRTEQLSNSRVIHKDLRKTIQINRDQVRDAEEVKVSYYSIFKSKIQKII